VLGPVVANEELGGAGAWATILAVGGIGAIAGGLVAFRIRPSRPLVACIVSAMPWSLQLIALALNAPVWLIAATAFVANAGLALHLTLWFTVFQREIPERAQSRVSSYDALGSFVLNPVGAAIAGPVAVLLGIEGALVLAAGAIVAADLAMLTFASVWAIRSDRYETAPEAA
jgi:hypothetical protein